MFEGGSSQPAVSEADSADAPSRLGADFVRRWLDCVGAALGLRAEFPFARVRRFGGQARRVCVPYLSYAHLDAAGAAALLAGEKTGGSLVRHLAALPPDAPEGTPVISAVPLFLWRDADDFWEHALTANLRKKIRKATKSGHLVERSNLPAAARDFHSLFAATMHRHGTPPYPRELFEEALARCGGEVVTVRRGDTIVVAYFLLHDREIALFMWAGFNPAEDAGYASLLGEWDSIRDAFARDCRWFDLGRAPLGSPAWRHKQYWHPRLFHATTTPPPGGSVYSRYAFASRLWRRLPAGLACRLGPWVVSHLPDA